MILKNISFSSPLDNILYDEVLLHLSSKSEPREILRVWESPRTFVVLGRAGKIKDDVNIELALKDRIPILMRRSGGGTVLQGRGCLNYSLILSIRNKSELQDLHQSYRLILDSLLQALKINGINAVFKPLSDLALADNFCKFSGNAQHRAKDFILHHGTILYDFELSLIEKYLRIPKQVPDYRNGRNHQEFVRNIPLSKTKIEEMLKSCFKASQGEGMTQEEEVCLQQFRDEYSHMVLSDGINQNEKAFA